MALYNNYYPQYQQYPQQYQQNPYPVQQNQMPNQMQSQMQNQNQNTNQQIQQSGFIPVPSEEVARNYPVAPGNSVSFKNENAPYVYVKTMGYSPLDLPRFEKFRLVKEESDSETAQNAQIQTKTDEPIDLSKYALKSEYEALRSDLEALKKTVAKYRDSAKERNVRRNEQ